ncbi:MAG: hypothetical protein EA392_09770 [Cryomorphaceae bacterium]|nr:MAG: hypothetical protein EA392_09770 [Cryomorphaceae bacterium]
MLVVLAGMVLVGCRNDDDAPCCDPTNPECPNYDPCWDKYPTADFKMRQTSVGFVIPDHLQAEWCDTILGSGVEFLADMEGALSYTWQIGSEAQTRSGRNLKLSFQSYIASPTSLNPDNPDYYNPLPITLTVRNAPGACVNESDTVLTITRLLVLTSRSLTRGTFRGRVEGENFDRDVILWQEAGDLSHPNFIYWYVSHHIGLPFKDTLKMFVPSPLSMVTSYKQIRWDEDWHNYSTSRDGVRKWNQQITTSANGPDRIDLFFERIPEDNSGLQTVKFSGYRIE